MSAEESGEEERVGDVAAVAERLRLVRAARRKFLRLWAIEQALVGPLIDRVAEDLEPVAQLTEPDDDDETTHGPPPQADKG